MDNPTPATEQRSPEGETCEAALEPAPDPALRAANVRAFLELERGSDRNWRARCVRLLAEGRVYDESYFGLAERGAA